MSALLLPATVALTLLLLSSSRVSVGTLGLPFLWFVNVVWFYPYAFRTTYESEEDESRRRQLKRYILWSAIGVAVWSVVLVAWVSFFQINRTSLAWGDAFTFMLPVGHA